MTVDDAMGTDFVELDDVALCRGSIITYSASITSSSVFSVVLRFVLLCGDVDFEEVKEIAGKQFNPGMTDYFLNELHPGRNEDVFDPWYGGYDGFEKVYQLIDETCNAILKSYFTALKTTQAQL